MIRELSHASSAAGIERGSRRDLLTREILTGVFEQRFEPGQRMKVEELASLFSVSVTPVRESLVQLAGLGIVELAPNRGAVLRPFGNTQLHELAHLRRVLECEAVRCACGRFTPVECDGLIEKFQTLCDAPRDARWSAETRSWDNRLHNMIRDRCGSERLAYELGRYETLHRTLREVRHRHRQARENYESMDENAEHLRIIEAIAANDPDEAAQAMADHVDTAAAVLARDLFDAEAGE